MRCPDRKKQSNSVPGGLLERNNSEQTCCSLSDPAFYFRFLSGTLSARYTGKMKMLICCRRRRRVTNIVECIDLDVIGEDGRKHQRISSRTSTTQDEDSQEGASQNRDDFGAGRHHAVVPMPLQESPATMSFSNENSVAGLLTKLVGRERAERFPLLSRFDLMRELVAGAVRHDEERTTTTGRRTNPNPSAEEEDSSGTTHGGDGRVSPNAWLGVWVSARQELHIRSKVVTACLARHDRIKPGCPARCLFLRLALKLFSVVVFPRCFRLRRIFFFDSLENKLSFRRLHGVFGFRFREMAGWELHGPLRGLEQEDRGPLPERAERRAEAGDEVEDVDCDWADSGCWWNIELDDGGETRRTEPSPSERSAGSSTGRGPRGLGYAAPFGESKIMGPIISLWRVRHDQFSTSRNKRPLLAGGGGSARAGRGGNSPGPGTTGSTSMQMWTMQMEGGWALVHEERILLSGADRFVELNFALARDTGEVLWESVHEFRRINEAKFRCCRRRM